MTDAERFQRLFTGRADAFGTGEGRVVKRPLGIEEYENHLSGYGTGLGVFPLSDDGTVRFGAIDLDRPDFDLARQFQNLIPGYSFIERSRSGNAHVWVFFDGDAPAWAVRGLLSKATHALGHPEVEIFPKQDRLRPPSKYGNYINLPYHGETRPVLWHRTDTPMDLDAFLSAAEANLNDGEEWERRARWMEIETPEEREARQVGSADFGDAPVLHECAMHIIEHRFDNPVQPGARAVVLHNLSRMLRNYREMDDDEAWELVQLVNDASPDPLDERELRRNFDNAQGYKSTGCDNPIMQPYVDPNCPIARGELGR